MYRVLILVLYSTVFTYWEFIILYCVQSACASTVLDGVHILGYIIMYCVQGAGTGAVLDGVHVLGVHYNVLCTDSTG